LVALATEDRGRKLTVLWKKEKRERKKIVHIFTEKNAIKNAKKQALKMLKKKNFLPWM
jgi:hypothetical protein